MINVCTEQKQGILCKMHCCYRHNLSLSSVLCSGHISSFGLCIQGLFLLLAWYPVRNMRKACRRSLLLPTLWPAGKQPSHPPDSNGSKSASLYGQLIPISHSHHVMCSAGSVLWFEDILMGSSPHFFY